MTGTVTSSFKAGYVPYGPSFGVTGSEVFQYTGKLLDHVTGFYYEGARYYDPETGRFITEDSVVGTGDDPQSLNRYVYARDNPMKIVDMAGHEWWNPVAALSSAASTVVGAAENVGNEVSNAWNSLPPTRSSEAQLSRQWHERQRRGRPGTPATDSWTEFLQKPFKRSEGTSHR